MLRLPRSTPLSDRTLVELRSRIKAMTEQVQAIRVWFDELFAWMRHCFDCGRPLEKQDPGQPLRCVCGWEWK